MRELPFEHAFRRWAGGRGVEWRTVEYRREAAGGDTRALHLLPPEAARGLVLVAHGAGNDALFGFVGLFKRLLERGLSVFSFHLDGHGRGCDTRFAASTAVDAVGDALARSGAAAAGLPVHGLGVSLGGAVLLRALPALAPPLATATLMVTPLRIRFSPTAFLAELGPAALSTVWRERVHYGLTGLVPSFGPFKRDAYPLRLAAPRTGAFGYVPALNAALAEMRLEEAARDTRVPTLLVYGTRDRLVPPEQGESLHHWMPGSALLRIPGGTHLTTPLDGRAVSAFLGWIATADPVSPTHPPPGGDEGRR